MAFVHLNVHSAYSLLAGTMKPEDIPALARRRGFDALALTDTDGLFAAVPFQRACEREGVHALLGAEITRPRQRREASVQGALALDEPEPARFGPATRELGGFARERPALFDLSQSPTQERDVRAGHVDVTERLRGQLRRFHELAESVHPCDGGSTDYSGMDVETLNNLAALGYLSAEQLDAILRER